MRLGDQELPETFVSWPLHIKSGQAEAVNRRYHAIEYAPNNYWLYADEPAAADHVYVGCSDLDHKSEGFGGATLSFDLIDGSVLKLKGPWKASAKKMLRATGVDITDRYSSRGVIAFSKPTHDRNGGGYFGTDTYTDLVHLDEDWVIGDYDRIDCLAQDIANETGRLTYFYAETQGGSHSGCREPESCNV